MIFFGTRVPNLISDYEPLLSSREPYNKHRKVRVVLKDEKFMRDKEPKIPKEIHEAVKKITEEENNRLYEGAKSYKLGIDWDNLGRTTLGIFRGVEEVESYSAPLHGNVELSEVVNEAIKALEAVNPRKGM